MVLHTHKAFLHWIATDMKNIVILVEPLGWNHHHLYFLYASRRPILTLSIVLYILELLKLSGWTYRNIWFLLQTIRYDFTTKSNLLYFNYCQILWNHMRFSKQLQLPERFLYDTTNYARFENALYINNKQTHHRESHICVCCIQIHS